MFSSGQQLILEFTDKISELKYHSRILGYKIDQFVISEPPFLNNVIVPFEKGLHLRGQVDFWGQIIGFDTEVMETFSFNGKPICVLFKYPSSFFDVNARTTKRFNVYSPAHLVLDEKCNCTQYKGLILDLSEFGCFFSFAETNTIPIDTKVAISFRLPNGYELKDLPGVIQRETKTDTSTQLGIKFDFTKRMAEKNEISRFLKTSSSQKN